MDEIEKFFRKLSPAEQKRLAEYMNDIVADVGSFNVKKLVGTEFYRERKGRFRFIFHYTSDNRIKLVSVRLRDEKTHRDF